MLLATVACLVALAGVLAVLYAEQPAGKPAPAGELDLAGLARTEFRLALPGYAPAAVDTAFHGLRLAYADLLAEAPADAVERARTRTRRRLAGEPSVVHDGPAVHDDTDAPRGPQPSEPQPRPDGGSNVNSTDSDDAASSA